MKQSGTAIKTLRHRYRTVLLKCALINMAAFTVALPARALDISSGAHKDESITDADISISGGTFDNVQINASNSMKITNGTFNETVFSVANGLISGGNFTNARIYSNGSGTETDNGLTITGGTFSGTISSFFGNTLNLSGGNFDNIDWWDKGATNWNINSDKVSINLKAGKNFHSLYAKAMNITGNRGIFLTKTSLKVGTLSGKATLNKDAFAGDFYGMYIKHHFGDGIFYEPDSRFALPPTTAEANFNNADLILNGNSQAGIGFYAESISAADFGKIKDYSDTLDRYDECWKDFSAVRNKLTQADIADSIGVILSELKKVDATTRKRDDLPNSLSDESLYTLGYFLNSPANLLQPVLDAWENGQTPDWKKLEQDLYEAYNNFSAAMDNFGGNVTVQNSVVTMNGTAGLINDSFKSGNLSVAGSTISVNGNNEISAKNGTVSLDNSTLNVAKNAVLNVASNDGNVLHFKNGGRLNLGGILNAQADFSETQINFQTENARIRGTISGTVSLNFSDDYSISTLKFADGANIRNITIANGKTLDIGAGTLKAGTITGGTISAVLTDAAKSSAIISASASNVTLNLRMAGVSRDMTTLYKITDGTGFNLGNYSTSRYAVSKTYFDPQDAKNIGRLQNWDGGDLYILQLASASEAAIEDVEKNGNKVSQEQRDAAKILDIEDEFFNKLDKKTQDTIDRITDLLDRADSQTAGQILREIAPDTMQSARAAASNTAKSVINIVQNRFGGFAEYSGGGYHRAKYGNRSGRYRGRSGGDFESGRVSVWTQGMMNYARLDKKGDGFNAHSGGFAAGFEGNPSDDLKIGTGYAYTATDITTGRAATDVDTHTGFVYGEYKPYKAYMNVVIGYGRSEYDEKTHLTEMKSDYTVDTVSAQVTTGYDFGLFSPQAALRFTNVRQNEYTDALGAKFKKSIQNTWTGIVGAKMSGDYYLNALPFIGLTPELKIAATYDFNQDNDNRTVVLPDLSEYRVKGDPLDKFGVEAGAGLTIAFGRGGELSLEYDGDFKKDYTDHTGMMNLKINF